MPWVRLTYAKDIEREGADAVEVSEDRAQVLVNERRAVILPRKPARQRKSK